MATQFSHGWHSQHFCTRIAHCRAVNFYLHLHYQQIVKKRGWARLSDTTEFLICITENGYQILTKLTLWTLLLQKNTLQWCRFWHTYSLANVLEDRRADQQFHGDQLPNLHNCKWWPHRLDLIHDQTALCSCAESTHCRGSKFDTHLSNLIIYKIEGWTSSFEGPNYLICISENGDPNFAWLIVLTLLNQK